MKKHTYEAGIWKKQTSGYKSYLPSLINQPFVWQDKDIDLLLEKANLELGKLDSFSQFIPDVDFFISMHIGKEAIQSNRIEGSKTEIDELFINDESKNIEKRNDKQEVLNYIEALNFGIEELEKLPLSFRLFNKIHSILLQGVRGEWKTPGELRKSQNWIGGTNLQNAYFIPPAPEDLSNLTKDLELFLHNQDLKIPELIKVALMHYQFETIHPYLDGNGRTGRLLIILYLLEKKILHKPVLYLSDFLEKHRGSYYDALTIVRTGNIEHYLKFFLTGIIETCQSGIRTFENILKLKEIVNKGVISLGGVKSEKANLLLNFLYSNPIVSSDEVVEKLNISPATANSLLRNLISLGILEEITGKKKNKLYSFEEYLKIFR